MTNKNLFGNLLKNEGMYKASTIVEEMGAKFGYRKPIYSLSPSNSWGSAVGYLPGTMELLYGPRSSCKTMIVLDRIKQAQLLEPDAIQVFVDAEMNFEYESTIRWMVSNGVDPDRVLLIREVCMKTIFEKHFLENIHKELIAGNIKVNYSAIDSVQAMSVKDIADTDAKISKLKQSGGYTKQDYGARANYLARILPFFRKFCRDYQIFHTFIGQARSDGEDMHGNEKFKTNGGEALFHECQYITQCTDWHSPIFDDKMKDSKGNPVKIGKRIKFIFEKNKVGAGQFRQGHCDIKFMEGIVNREEELVMLSSKLGVISVSGSWMTYREYKFQGGQKFADHLKADPNLYNQIFSEVMLLASSRPEMEVVYDSEEQKKDE